MAINKEMIDQALQKDIRSVAEKLGLTLDMKGYCKCCFHAENTGSMHFDKKKNRWKCYGCGKWGDAIDLVMMKGNMGFVEAVKWILEGEMTLVKVDENEDDGVLRPLPIGIAERWRSDENLFCRSLVMNGILTREQMVRAAERYRIGTYHDGGVIFWQIDVEGRVRDGKIMYYTSNSHRSHEKNPNWMSSVLRRQGKYEGVSRKCLFGEHLLVRSSGVKVAVVESEKTAVICSAVMPEFVWVATGGMGNLNHRALEALKGRKVVVFPDTDLSGETYRRWREVCSKVEGVYVSDVLEREASDEQKIRKIDIADWLIEAIGR